MKQTRSYQFIITMEWDDAVSNLVCNPVIAQEACIVMESYLKSDIFDIKAFSGTDNILVLSSKNPCPSNSV